MAAETILGTTGTFTVRPEKIRIIATGTGVAEPALATYEQSASGTVRDVVYLGATRATACGLDAGGELVVDSQNIESTSVEVSRRERLGSGCAGEPHTSSPSHRLRDTPASGDSNQLDEQGDNP